MSFNLTADLSDREQVGLVYMTYFNRAPEPDGLGYWTNFYQNETEFGEGPTAVLNEISSRFSDSDEAQELFPFLANPASSDPDTFVSTVFKNLFNRDVDPQGLEFWSGQVQERVASNQPIGDIITEIAAGAAGADVELIENKIAAGLAYAEEIAKSDSDYAADDARQLLDSISSSMSNSEASQAGVEAASGANVPVPTQGASVADTTVPLTDTLFDGLLSGASWAVDDSRTITWALGDSSTFAFDPGAIEDIVAWADANIFSGFEKIIDLDFEFVGHFSDMSQSNANITIAAASDAQFQSLFGQGGILGFAQFPQEGSSSKAAFSELIGVDPSSYPYSEGDIVINSTIPAHSFSNLGSELVATLVHEVGHSLGLKHPFDGGPNNRPTFSELGYEVLEEDSFTSMAYDEFNEFSWQFGNVASPMPLDIGALQYMYGTNDEYNSGDTKYDVRDNGLVQALYDTGGDDTLDASGLQQGVTLNLKPGFVSTISSLTRFGIAPGTTVENANGGSGNDRILGNEAANRILGNAGFDELQGGGGDDFLLGGPGDDDIYGGEGYDVAVFTGYRDEYIISNVDGGYLVQDTLATDGVDYVAGVEALNFQDGEYSLIA